MSVYARGQRWHKMLNHAFNSFTPAASPILLCAQGMHATLPRQSHGGRAGVFVNTSHVSTYTTSGYETSMGTRVKASYATVSKQAQSMSSVFRALIYC